MANLETDASEKPAISWRIVALIVIPIVLAWIATPLILYKWMGKYEQMGQFGDLFGSINALFSGLAFAGVISAILLQRHELELQRKELRRSSTAQDEAQKALNKSLYAQTFKVALEIIEAPDVVKARGVIARNQHAFFQARHTWSEDCMIAAESVARTFESVGTLIRRNLLPAEFIVETWAIPINRNWNALKPYIDRIRDERADPYIGVDFEFLARKVEEFLDKKSGSQQEL